MVTLHIAWRVNQLEVEICLFCPSYPLWKHRFSDNNINVFFPFQLCPRVLLCVMFIAANTFTLMPSDSLACHTAGSVTSVSGMEIDWQADPVSHPGQVSSSGLPQQSWPWPYTWRLFSESVLCLNPEKRENNGWAEKQERGQKEKGETCIRMDCELKKAKCRF